jgi:GntR family histidine utilization transcriptional repressor
MVIKADTPARRGQPTSSTAAAPRAPGTLASQSVAPYARVREYLKAGLARARWRPGELMPSEAELVTQFGVSRMTANRALRELLNEGLVTRVQGVGTFAAELHHVSSTLTIRNLQEEIADRGHRHHAEVQLQRQEPATLGLAEQLGLNEGDPVFHTLIVHFDNGLPLQCEDRYVNPAAAPDYLGVDFTQTTPTRYLLDVTPMWHAQHTITASTATAQEARLLGIAAGAPCLVIVRRTIFGQVPITLARLVHPGDRYQLTGSFSP